MGAEATKSLTTHKHAQDGVTYEVGVVHGPTGVQVSIEVLTVQGVAPAKRSIVDLWIPNGDLSGVQRSGVQK